jgi:hypothetical protein
MMGQCQAAVAEAVASFGRLDILLCCTSQGIVLPLQSISSSSADMALPSGPWNCRGISRLTENIDSREGPIRNQLLWSDEHY